MRTPVWDRASSTLVYFPDPVRRWSGNETELLSWWPGKLVTRAVCYEFVRHVLTYARGSALGVLKGGGMYDCLYV